jgi:hypothetical protein
MQKILNEDRKTAGIGQKPAKKESRPEMPDGFVQNQ